MSLEKLCEEEKQHQNKFTGKRKGHLLFQIFVWTGVVIFLAVAIWIITS